MDLQCDSCLTLGKSLQDSAAQFLNLYNGVITVCRITVYMEMVVKVFPEVLLGRHFNILCFDNPTRVKGRGGSLKVLPE